jgi:uncharacterized phage-associated protein
MYSSEEKREIIINTLLYIVQQLGGVVDFHRVFKVLYFADEKHLARYGTAINPDRYEVKQYGPVPSMAYEVLKSLRGEGFMVELRHEFAPYFELINRYTVKAKAEPNMDYLSESEVMCLDESIEENRHLTFNGRTGKSHDPAYNNADNEGYISFLDMAKVGGANETMISYIKESIENQVAILR